MGAANDPVMKPFERTRIAREKFARETVLETRSSADALEARNDPVVSSKNIRRYLTAEMSLRLFGPVKESVFEDRKEQCMTCPRRFQSEKIEDEIGFCRSCSCGVSEKARLSSKLRMPEVSCPIGRWGPSRPHHRRFVDRAKSWLLGKLLG